MTAASKGAVLSAKILAEHGSHPDLRLWRNASAYARVGNDPENPVHIRTGLVKGAADLIGIGPGGRFWAVEVKAGGDTVKKRQRTFLKVVRELGGVAEVARSVEDVTRILERERQALQ